MPEREWQLSLPTDVVEPIQLSEEVKDQLPHAMARLLLQVLGVELEREVSDEE